MSTAKLVTRIVHMVFYLNWIVFINRPSQIFMVLDDNLAGQSVMCGCFKSFKRRIVWVTSSQFSLSPARVFSRILYRWRISVHFEFLPQKSLIRYTERDRMEFNTSSCLAVLSSWNLESLNSIWSSPWWYFPSHSWLYFQIRWFYIVSTCNFKCVQKQSWQNFHAQFNSTILLLTYLHTIPK